MGGAVADDATLRDAYEVGRLVAQRGFVLLNGGRDAGVMASSARGASEAGGLVIGILPSETTAGASPHIDIAIPTGMGDARNVINVLASHVIIALPGGAGTISEVALALKNDRVVVALRFPLGPAFATYYSRGRLVDADDPAVALDLAVDALAQAPR
jgi:hypothetical protein